MKTGAKPSSSRSPRVRKPTLLREVLRNLRRRKLRTFLTLSGIALGAFALTVMGSLAENFNLSVGSLRSFVEGQVLVRPRGSNPFFPSGQVSVAMVPDLDEAEGVDSVVPRSFVTFTDEGQFRFGPPDIIYGIDIDRALDSPVADLQLASGRGLRSGDRWKIVLGSEMSRILDPRGPLRVGDDVEIRGQSFEVVGIGAATSTFLDRFGTASIEDVRVMQQELEPFLNVDEIADEIMVFPQSGIDADELAEMIRPVVAEYGAEVYPPSATGQQLSQLTAIWNSIILGSALVALLVGGVAIINTMIFSVTERTREIGTKKAIGASSKDILREFLSESAILSVAGGLLGGSLGTLLVFALNAVSRGEGVVSFTVTPRLALFVLGLSVVVGIGAGLLPARRAASIDPVRALRTVG